jgi:hypothetical protein
VTPLDKMTFAEVLAYLRACCKEAGVKLSDPELVGLALKISLRRFVAA